MVVAYVGLGSNLDNPKRQVETALAELAKLNDTYLERHSSLYRSKPVGPQDQPDFINAVARLSTTLEPEALLDALQALEQSHHRIRGERWGPRSLDLDLLLYGNQFINTPRLKVPHPEIAKRSFVLLPLKEISPTDLSIPGVGALLEIKTDQGEGEVERLA
ncbi:MAG: 2-amino-4-hydroxy-6-hydroxymethyldihydropteridine diphosphokinase [Candidatus Thiodiazotropha sp. DIVDIV]